MTCIVPQNQPLYQALLDKAASYPPKPVKNNTQQVNSVTVELNISGKPLKLTFNSDDKSEKSLKGVNIECESTDVLIEFISEILDSANITPGMLMQYL